MKEQINKVKEFYTAFGQEFKTEPTNLEYERAKLRYRLIEEEVIELTDGIFKHDLNNAAKELCDCFYILLGTALELGIADKLEAFFDLVHESNMSKLGADGKPIFRADGKIIKSENYKPAKIDIYE